jgi:hypothetical protein
VRDHVAGKECGAKRLTATYGSHTQCVDTLAGYGIAAPAEWAVLLDRFA